MARNPKMDALYRAVSMRCLGATPPDDGPQCVRLAFDLEGSTAPAAAIRVRMSLDEAERAARSLPHALWSGGGRPFHGSIAPPAGARVVVHGPGVRTE